MMKKRLFNPEKVDLNGHYEKPPHHSLDTREKKKAEGGAWSFFVKKTW